MALSRALILQSCSNTSWLAWTGIHIHNILSISIACCLTACSLVDHPSNKLEGLSSVCKHLHVSRLNGIELKFIQIVFQMELTLAIIKPHLFKNTPAFRNVINIIKENFTVLDAKEVHITKQLSEQFYLEHKGKFFYNRLTTFMGSGPCYALILQSHDCISKWRQLLGPTKVYKAVYTDPTSIRALYGLSDTRNACHGSDSEESATREISILFPEFQQRIANKSTKS